MKRLLAIFAILIVAALATAKSLAPTPLNETTKKLTTWFEAHPTGRLYVQLDKPLYKPGETIWLKASLFDTKALAPYTEAVGYKLKLLEPSGAVVVEKAVQMKDGAGAADVVIPKTVAGGEYKIQVECLGGPTEDRPVVVQAYQAPLIQKELTVLGKAYGPGDRVEAKAEFRRGTGENLAGHPITGIVTVDGRVADTLTLKTDAEGKLAIAFDLPDTIREDNASLTLKVTEGGLTESISRGIPILLSKMNVDFFPEGGELVTGLQSQVYFAAKKPNGKPAKLEGIIVDNLGAEIATVASYHHGMGRFAFTPEAGKSYRLKVTRPSTVTRSYPLPGTKRAGVVMEMLDGDQSDAPYCCFVLRSTQNISQVMVVASLREQVVGSETTELVAGEEVLVTLHPKGGQGVMRITVLAADGTPLCERVVYRNRGQDLKVEITPDKESYMPREPVTLTVRTTADGKPVPADLALSVVDDRALTYADDKTAHILSHLYLEKDLPGDIEEPNFYLDIDEEKSALALDLLMGTRGWRTFQWQRIDGKDDVQVTDQLLPKTMKDEVAKLFPPPMPMPGAVFALAAGMPKMARVDAFAFAEEAAIEVDLAVADDNFAEGPAELAPVAEPAALPVVAAEPPVAAAPPPPAAKPMPAARQVFADADIAFDIAADEAIANNGLRAKRRARRATWAVVRVFPKVTYKTTETKVRSDFRDTLAWEPSVRTDKTGIAKVTLHLSDAITAFRIRAEGAGLAGLPGRAEKVIDSRTPFHIQAKLPVVLSAGDRLDLPIQFRNETDKPLDVSTGYSFASQIISRGKPRMSFSLAANSANTIFLPLEAKFDEKPGKIAISASAAGLNDSVSREIRVEPVGFPREFAASETLEKTVSETITLPKEIVDGSLTAKATFYPAPLASMLDGLDSMLREPSGCFEQTSSSTYPNIMILSYLRRTGKVAPDIEARATKLIEKGYKRLISFECPQKGYEWFGRGAGHEALTAYGIMEFVDMAKVTDLVDDKMLDRTAQWILAQRDGKGGYKRNAAAIDSFGRASATVTDAYITWGLAEAGIEGIDKEIDHNITVAYKARNPYISALAMLAESARNPKSAELQELAEHLTKARQKDGSFKGSEASITGSSGRALDIETTSLAIMALLRAGRPASTLNDSIQWLTASRQGGGFGPTQSTILALKALIDYADASRTVEDDGDIVMRVNGSVVARRHFNKGDQGAIVFADLAEHLQTGDNDINLELISKQSLPYSIDLEWKTPVPVADSATPVRLTTTLANSAPSMGDSVNLTAVLTNTSDEGQAMALARIGIPAGLSPQLWQLKELRENGVIDFYETTPREIILYFRSLAPKAEKTIVLQLRADLPGEFTSIASSAYLYYGDDHKWWVDPVKVAIAK
jgi:alpha-2-macroglobulin-like protein